VSGFAGIVSTDGAPPDRNLLERIAARLAFRGPDATHIAIQPGAGFCFTFLRTGPAPQSPSQPCSLDGRVWLLGDVRLDARNDLQRKLQQHGTTIPPGITDEELVLQAWRVWDEAVLPELLGDFSFTLWDAEARRLLCVRDLMGARPLYYANAGGRLCFSNTLEVLLLLPGIPTSLNHEFIGDFLLQEYSSIPANTVYQQISRLPSGHLLEYAGGERRVRRYATLPIEEPLWLKRPEEYVEGFQSVLEQAVRDRLPNTPSAIFLSGGLDSTSLAAVATQIAAAPGLLHAYTMDCQPQFDDQEGRLASLVAKHLSIPIEILSGASCLPYEGWDDPPLRMPEPYHDPFFILGRLQYQHVGTRARVAFSGYGGDDVLTGQAWPHLVYLLRRWRLATLGKTFGEYVLKHKRLPPLRGGFRTRLRRWVRPTDVMAEYPRWLEPRFEKQQHLRERWRELQWPLETSHPLHPVGYAGLAANFWSRIFEVDDAAWTKVPVELRAPLLDQRVLRYLLRVPPVPWCVEKELLRQAMRGLLPEVIRTRPKTPLLGDSLKLLAQSGTWSPVPLSDPAEELRTFVNWEQLAATLALSAVSTLWTDLLPVSLDRWLKAIENERRIR
jgi:asparagine synthase (glutamine-hydrolysing)